MAAVTCRSVSKWFGDAPALSAVDLTVEAGEIHVILGENGAGKSTLVKIIAGLMRADDGHVEVGDLAVDDFTVAQMQAAGVALIHQEPRLFPDLTVHENVWVDEPSSTGRGRRHSQALVGETRAILARLGCRVEPDRKVSELSVADQQLVDVAAALRRDLSVLIVDEPTASLTPAEVQQLFAVLRGLRDQGVTVIFIGHRLGEILDIGDRITVLRDGRVVATITARATSEDELVRLMVGRQIEAPQRRVRDDATRVALVVRELSSPGSFERVSFDVSTGEILGIGGLVGAGRTELLEAIFGLRRRSRGTVCVAGGRTIRSPRMAIRNGLGLVPEDRGRHGLVTTRSIRENVAAANLLAISPTGIRHRARELSIAERVVSDLRVKARGTEQALRELSGGNQQKVSLGKWLVGGTTVLLVDEPTRGVDVGSKAEIHGLLLELVAKGMAVIMVSSDMRELLSLSDRIIVMREGRVSGQLAAADATEESVLRLASGAAA